MNPKFKHSTEDLAKCLKCHILGPTDTVRHTWMWRMYVYWFNTSFAGILQKSRSVILRYYDPAAQTCPHLSSHILQLWVKMLISSIFFFQIDTLCRCRSGTCLSIWVRGLSLTCAPLWRAAWTQSLWQTKSLIKHSGSSCIPPCPVTLAWS